MLARTSSFSNISKPRRLKLTVAIVAAVLMLCSCGGLQKPKFVKLVVRPLPGSVVSHSATYEVFNHRTSQILKRDTTNSLGFFIIDRPKKSRFEDFEVRVTYQALSESQPLNAVIRLNDFVGYYDIYLNEISTVPPENRTADFHYHVSMKPHNSFGQYLYQDKRTRREREAYVAPDTTGLKTIGWQKLETNLEVYYNGEWSRVKLKSAFSSNEEKEKMRMLLEGKWVRSREGANNFKHFTEATTPHTIEGSMYLAFNAISPFEHSVSNDGVKRAVSSGLKTGASIKWLGMMGHKNRFITHWENFNNEYRLINEQRTDFNNFSWRVLKKGESIADGANIPVVVNVVEGGHILQDRYFPHFVNYDLMDSTVKQKELFQYVKSRARALHDDQVSKRLNSIEDLADSPGKRKLMAVVADSILFSELIGNVSALKKMDIHMMAISHLSYNGMTGHSPALDVSLRPFKELLFSWIAQRAYSISTSNDVHYRKAYDGLFFRVPGVNAYGDTIISRLLDPKGGGRVQIDLKHSDVITRRFLFNKMDSLSKSGTAYPPICSHCAVNGLSIDYTSPLLNEYRMRRSQLARKFYPFAINLYNEEIKLICEREGLIGIPLEERVLGGYIDNKIEYPVTFKKAGRGIKMIPTRSKCRRTTHMISALHYLRQQNQKEMDTVLAFYRRQFASIRDRDLFKLVVHDYCSAEPFLQNLFHIVDIAHLAGKEDRRGRLLVAAAREVANEEHQRGRLYADSVRTQKVLQKIESDETAAPVPSDPGKSWRNICLGSDLDGLIDPINICSSASSYPFFKEKLEILIPLFLHIRENFEVQDKLLGHYRGHSDYFPDDSFSVRTALDRVFYSNLYDFTVKHFGK